MGELEPSIEKGFRVQAKPCTTCIYRKDSPLNIKKLETYITNSHGYFFTYRVCHRSPKGKDICCRGFWSRHKDSFPIGQIAQRLNCVVFVDE